MSVSKYPDLKLILMISMTEANIKFLITKHAYSICKTISNCLNFSLSYNYWIFHQFQDYLENWLEIISLALGVL